MTGAGHDDQEPGLIDQQEQLSALLLLLWPEPNVWQHRLVYRIELSTTTHARVSAHYHLVIPPAWFELVGVAPTNGPVRSLLPLTWRPKELLLNLSLGNSTGCPVHLLTRADSAWLEADVFVDHLSRTDLMINFDVDLVYEVVEAIARFMPRRVRAAADLVETSPPDQIAARLRDPAFVATYLTAETGVAIGEAEVRRWAAALRGPERVLSEAMGRPISSESSAENFLLALGGLRPAAADDLDFAVHVFVTVVLGLHARGEASVLRLLARLGREWRVIVDTDVLTERPVTIVMSDDRPIGPVDVRSAAIRVPVPLADGSSLHVETQLLDPSAMLRDVKVVAADDESELPLTDDVRETDDRHAVYLSTVERPDRGLAMIEVGLTSDVRWTTNAVLTLALLALILSAAVANQADTLALLVIPATLAVSVVQVREQTSIVRSLTSRSRGILFGVAIALWLVAALRLLLQSEGGDGLFKIGIRLIGGEG